MAQKLEEWLETEVSKVKSKPQKFIAALYFNRIELRPTYIDSGYFFTPADGVILGAWNNLKADDPIVELKGRILDLRKLMDNSELEGEFCVVSIFMTYYSQHQNYIPFAGVRAYREIPPIRTNNFPMLAVEKDLFKGVINPEFQEPYLRNNGREISNIYAPKLQQNYHVVRIADYDVDNIVNWRPDKADWQQNDNFGMIRFGSQCFLIIEQMPESGISFELRKEAEVGNYVKCKIDPVVSIKYS